MKFVVARPREEQEEIIEFDLVQSESGVRLRYRKSPRDWWNDLLYFSPANDERDEPILDGWPEALEALGLKGNVWINPAFLHPKMRK